MNGNRSINNVKSDDTLFYYTIFKINYIVKLILPTDLQK